MATIETIRGVCAHNDAVPCGMKMRLEDGRSVTVTTLFDDMIEVEPIES